MPRKNLFQRIKQIYPADAKYSLSLLTGLLVSVVVVKLNSKNLIFFNNVRFAIYFHFIALLTIIAALIDVMMPNRFIDILTYILLAIYMFTLIILIYSL